MYEKRNKLKTRSEPNLVKDAEPSESYDDDREPYRSAKVLNVCDIDKLA